MRFPEFYNLFQEDVNYQKIVNPLLKHLNKKELILDAGCGSGHLMVLLSKLGYKVIGIDKDIEMLTLASNNLIKNAFEPNLFIHNLNKPIPFKVNQIISLLDVINYFKYPKKMIKNLSKALESNGTLIIDLYKEPFKYFEEDNLNGIYYKWEITPYKNKIKHIINVEIDNQKYKYRLNQYIYPLSHYLKIFKKYHLEGKIINGFDNRKHYLILTKK